MKKLINVTILVGILTFFLVIGAQAAATIAASQVTYNNTTVQAKVDELVSIANTGKSQIATAITNKGISTSASASFATMASNINAISIGRKVIYLGTGTSFNVQSVCNQNGIPWNALSTGNFIVGVSSSGSVSTTSVTLGSVGVWARANGFTVSSSYNASTGVLTISGAAQIIDQGYYSSNVSRQATQGLNAFAYLVY